MSKGPHPATRLIVYPVIAVCFFVLFYFLALSATGYKLEFKNGKITTTATGMIVVATKPGAAKVSVDNKLEIKQTPLFSFLNLTIKGVSIGEHKVKIEKEGYETWEGVFNVKPKLVSWVDYIILVPQNKKTTNFKLPGTVTDTVLNDGKTRAAVLAEDTKTNFRTYWDINLQTKEKQKIREEKILTGEKVDLITYNYNASRLLITKTIEENKSNIVLESKFNGSVWNITSLYQMNFNSLKFSPSAKNELYVSKESNLYKLDYDKKNMSAVIANNVINFYTNNNDIYLIKKTEDNIGLWRLNNNQKLEIVVKVLPASEGYQFKHLTSSDSFIVLSEKDKELLLYQKDNNGNPISKSIARNANRFLLSPKEERVLIQTGSGVKIYDIEKSTYFDVLTDKVVDSVLWLNDKNNIVYSFEGKSYLVTYDGQYNKYIFDNLKGSQIYATTSSPNIYLLNSNKEINDLAVYSFDF